MTFFKNYPYKKVRNMMNNTNDFSENDRDEVEVEVSLTLPNILMGILFVTLTVFVVKMFGPTFTDLAQHGLRGWIAIIVSSIIFITGIIEVVQFLRELYIILYISLYLGLDYRDYYIKDIEEIDDSDK